MGLATNFQLLLYICNNYCTTEEPHPRSIYSYPAASSIFYLYIPRLIKMSHPEFNLKVTKLP
jgi:hypothetical protein